LLTVLSLVIAAVPVAAAGDPAYRADFAPTGADAGTTSTLVVTIKQLASASDQKVRSARLSAPGGISIDQATAKRNNTTLNGVTTTSGSVTIDNIPSLSSNQAVTVTLKVSIPCGQAGTKTWEVVAKNGTDFATGGTALDQASDSQLDTSVTKCSLAFDTQPALAQKGEIITSDPADPTGERVKVQLRDGNGDPTSQSGVQVTLALVSSTAPSGVTLGGDTEDATNGDGIARFEPTIGTTARGYKLRASASDPQIADSDASSAFNIEDVAKLCNGSCEADPPSKAGTTAEIDVTSNGGILTVSLGLDDAELTCENAANDFYEDSSSTVTWDVTQAGSRTVVIIRLDASQVDRPYNLYDVCFSAPSYGFRNRFNVRIEPGEAGLLKICPPRLDKQNADPCVVDKWRENGDVLIKFSVPPGDPRGRI
jgi:hypothetical protein